MCYQIQYQYLSKVTITNHYIVLINCKDVEHAWLNKWLFVNSHGAVKLSLSFMNCPLIIANFGITSTNHTFLINAILVDVLCNFDVILFNLI